MAFSDKLLEDIIGEAATHFPDNIQEQNQEIPWYQMKGMRNILIHEYFRGDTIMKDDRLYLIHLSESTQRLSENFKANYSGIEWYKIAGLRNILVHDYLGIDLVTVWVVVNDKLPELKALVKSALSTPKS